MQPSIKIPAGVLACLLLLSVSRGQTAAEQDVQPDIPDNAQIDTQPGDVLHESALANQVIATYRNTRTMQTQIAFSIDYEEAGWQHHRKALLSLAFDREKQAVRIDGPQWSVINHGGHMIVRRADLPTRFVTIPVEQPPTAEVMMGLSPLLPHPPLSEVMLLLSDAPLDLLIHALADGELATVSELAAPGDDPDAQPCIIVTGKDWTVTFWIDTQTHLVTRTRYEIIETRGESRSTLTINLVRQSLLHNQPVPDDVFAPDTSRWQEVENLQALSRMSASVDTIAPVIELQTLDGQPYRSDEETAQILVIEFWASWCGPCRASLPLMQEVYDWVKENDKPVAVYAVNLREPKELATRYWQQNQYRLPTLLDVTGSAGRAFGVINIPVTYIIHKGKIAQVYTGVGPGHVQRMIRQIDALLAQDEQ